MSLTAGTRLGPHEIVAPLGAGETGEIHRAILAVVPQDEFIEQALQLPSKKAS